MLQPCALVNHATPTRASRGHRAELILPIHWCGSIISNAGLKDLRGSPSSSYVTGHCFQIFRASCATLGVPPAVQWEPGLVFPKPYPDDTPTPTSVKERKKEEEGFVEAAWA